LKTEEEGLSMKATTRRTGLRKYTLAGAAALGAVSILGGALAVHAQTSPGSSSTATTAAATSAQPDHAAQEQAYLAALAGNLAISVDTLTAALKTTSLSFLDKAVADGKITADEAANIRTRIEAGDLGIGFGGGPRDGGEHGKRARPIANPEALATFLGTTAGQVRTELQGGSTLAQVADAHGKSCDELKAFLVSEEQAHLAQAVADGHLTQPEADTKLAEFQGRVDSIVDGAGFPGPGGPGDHGSMGGPHHEEGAPPTAPATTN
jgi:hypothetical protein